MKVKNIQEVNYFSIDPEFKITSSALFQLLQETAVSHSGSVGYGIDTLIKQGEGWVLNKIDMTVFRYPKYNEKIEVTTWSRKIKGVKGLREFEIYSGNEKLVAASSIWIFVDIIKGKIKRIPKEMNDTYRPENEIALNQNLDKWKAAMDFIPDHEIDLSIRFLDYDPMGHVNNSVYIQFLETLICRAAGNQARVKCLKIQ
ncbi:MAG: hypothetical protein GY864_02975, partial [Desulfobacterales bacterium]|nr:hypothetical protein [Desulfobacterales bacterium]